jgi:hypothetical protein
MQCENLMDIPLKGTKPVKWIKTACGKCEPCLIKKQAIWTQRLQHEAKYYKWNEIVFITLTYDMQYLPKNNSLIKSEVRRFIERLKRYYLNKLRIRLNIKYFASGEYGTNNGRPHYHLIVMGFYVRPDWISPKDGKTLGIEIQRRISRSWGKGFASIELAQKASFSYTANHQTKKQHHQITEKQLKPFITMTKGNRYNRYASMGARYAKNHADEIIKNGYRIKEKRNPYEPTRNIPINKYYKTLLPKQSMIEELNNKIQYQKDCVKACAETFMENRFDLLRNNNAPLAEKYQMAKDLMDAVQSFNLSMRVKRPSCRSGRGL